MTSIEIKENLHVALDTLRARKARCSIIQIGLDYFPRTRGASTLSSVKVIVELLKDLARRWPELR